MTCPFTHVAQNRRLSGSEAFSPTGILLIKAGDGALIEPAKVEHDIKELWKSQHQSHDRNIVTDFVLGRAKHI